MCSTQRFLLFSMSACSESERSMQLEMLSPQLLSSSEQTKYLYWVGRWFLARGLTNMSSAGQHCKTVSDPGLTVLESTVSARQSCAVVHLPASSAWRQCQALDELTTTMERGLVFPDVPVLVFLSLIKKRRTLGRRQCWQRKLYLHAAFLDDVAIQQHLATQLTKLDCWPQPRTPAAPTVTPASADVNNTCQCQC
jgi:hypothetical protein